MPRATQEQNDQRLTVYLPEGAVSGRALRFSDTGVEALMERDVPRDERYGFTLHLPGGVMAGEVTCVGSEDRRCRLQFAALTPRDRARLEPLMESDD